MAEIIRKTATLTIVYLFNNTGAVSLTCYSILSAAPPFKELNKVMTGIDNSANKELIRLFLEASGLVVKLTNYIENQQPPACELHLAAARDFIERNKLYSLVLGSLVKGNTNE